jgi:hypothetical protein
LQPVPKPSHRRFVGENVDDIAGVPPPISQITSRSHVEWFGKASWIGSDVNELRDHLRRDSDVIARRKESGKHVSCGAMLGVLQHLGGHQKARVESQHHWRPSSISPRRSSFASDGCNMEPRLTGGMSRMLCREPFADDTGAWPKARTVTSAPSGKRRPSSSTTTPFCTCPRKTIVHLCILETARVVYHSDRALESSPRRTFTAPPEDVIVLTTAPQRGGRTAGNHPQISPITQMDEKELARLRPPRSACPQACAAKSRRTP